MVGMPAWDPRAVLVAVKSPHARWAWVLWLVSNASWTIYGLATANYALALQQGRS